MARGKGKNGANGHSKKRPIERYEHKDKKRINNPPVGLVTPETDPPLPTHKIYDYIEPVPAVKPGKNLDYDPHLDPQLVWAGKKEHASFEVPTVSLHVHETIDPRTIIEAVRKRNGNGLRNSEQRKKRSAASSSSRTKLSTACSQTNFSRAICSLRSLLLAVLQPLFALVWCCSCRFWSLTLACHAAGFRLQTLAPIANTSLVTRVAIRSRPDQERLRR